MCVYYFIRKYNNYNYVHATTKKVVAYTYTDYILQIYKTVDIRDNMFVKF